MSALILAFGILGVLAGTVCNAADKNVPPPRQPTAEEALQHLRDVCARHNQIPATDMRSCIDCAFGQHADRLTGQCVDPSTKPMTAEEALKHLREVCARHDQVPATDRTSCIPCPFGQHADRATGQCVEPVKLRGKR